MQSLSFVKEKSTFFFLQNYLNTNDFPLLQAFYGRLPKHVYSLLTGLLAFSPEKRLSALEATQSPWFHAPSRPPLLAPPWHLPRLRVRPPPPPEERTSTPVLPTVQPFPPLPTLSLQTATLCPTVQSGMPQPVVTRYKIIAAEEPFSISFSGPVVPAVSYTAS